MSFPDDFDNGWPEPEELEAAMRSMETLDRAFSWLVYGQEQNKPDDEQLRSLDRGGSAALFTDGPLFL